MATWKELFGDELCKCGKKGEHILSYNGRVIGYECETCKQQREENLNIDYNKKGE